MKSFLNHFKKIKWYNWIIAISLLVIQLLTYWIGNSIANQVGTTSYAFMPKIACIDDHLPVLGFFGIFYLYSYIYWIESYANATSKGKRKMLQVIAGAMLAYILSIFIYVFLPTYMDREQEGLLEIANQRGLSSFLLRFIYSNDGWSKAYNLFPSYHCLVSVYCYLQNHKDDEKTYRIYSLCVCILICTSSVLTKQHYIIDSIVGIILGIGFYLSTEYILPKFIKLEISCNNNDAKIEIIEVKTKKEIKEFLDFPLKLYKNNPYYVPALYMDEKKLFTKKNTYLDQAENVFYLAKRGNEVVGRIEAILQHASNEKWNQKRVRFTRFDSIDDSMVAKLLLEAVESYAKSKGMDEVVGPLGYSDLEREGLLIEGFEELSTYEEAYNYSYYQSLIESNGYIKEVDWVERQGIVPKVDQRVKEVSKRVMERYNLHYGVAKNTKDFIRKYKDGFFQILDETYANIYGTVPFTEQMKKMLIDNFKLVLDMRYISLILDQNERIVAFAICFPSLSKAMQSSGGHLTIKALFTLYKNLKRPTIIDFGLIGVIKEYQSKGLISLIMNKYLETWPKSISLAETNLNLEDNHAIQNVWKNYDCRIHKRRRCYIKKIGELIN